MSTTNERYKLNKELAQMLKGGVIMDVTTPEQAKIAEAAGACAVMALERIPADIRAAGGVSRMSDPKMIEGIQECGFHSCYGQSAGSDILWRPRCWKPLRSTILMKVKCFLLRMISIISTKETSRFLLYAVPKDLGEALRRINEGASMIRTKGEPGTGDIVQAVRHMRKMNQRDCKTYQPCVKTNSSKPQKHSRFLMSWYPMYMTTADFRL